MKSKIQKGFKYIMDNITFQLQKEKEEKVGRSPKNT